MQVNSSDMYGGRKPAGKAALTQVYRSGPLRRAAKGGGTDACGQQQHCGGG